MFILAGLNLDAFLTLVLLEKIDYLSEYNSSWIAAWMESPSFAIWEKTHNVDYLSMINPGHPNHGSSMLDSFAASFSAFSKTAMASASGSLPSKTASEGDTTTASPASSLLQNVTSWYSSKVQAKSSIPVTDLNIPAEGESSTVKDELKKIQQMIDRSSIKAESYEDVKL